MLRAKYRKYRIATCLNQVTSAQQKKLRKEEAFRQKINVSILRHLYQTMMGVSAVLVIYIAYYIFLNVKKKIRENSNIRKLRGNFYDQMYTACCPNF